MSLQNSFESDHKAKALQSEIRKLKLELLKQELDDKLLTLKAYLHDKKLNETTTTTNEPETEADSSEKSHYLGNILFVKVAGNVQVWQLVLAVLIFWMLLSKFILLSIKFQLLFFDIYFFSYLVI